ncbi:MAG: Fic family protein [Vampirovibrionales bacterium]|nr:Fic family protein [Vampirovibrionales bacterium]
MPLMEPSLPLLPLDFDLETQAVLKKLAKARGALAELKGVAELIPNEAILINTLTLQEAKDSSAIENIITTHDDLYRSDAFARQFVSTAAKEVYNYATALKTGYQRVKETGLLTNNDLLDIQAHLEENRAGFRKLPGTALLNQQTGETVYTPPQNPDQIIALMGNLEQFINDEALCDWDPLIRMAVIHHQFESIHPFYDGNGRTGRILNILYLVKSGLLDTPVLYLSRYINQNRTDYYRLLQAARLEGETGWQDWILYLLDGVETTAFQTIRLIHSIRRLMQHTKQTLRQEIPKIYSQDLLNTLFNHPYTKIAFVERELGVTRLTATRYLDEMVRLTLMTKLKLGRDSYYINNPLFELLRNAQDL